ncbi:MAG TPA: amidohydrolase family protein, partial [Gemmatimonadaceae bacterium]
MKRFHARWVVPITAPSIHDGTVAVDDGRIAYVGPRASAPAGEDLDLEDAVLLPGLVNAHTHLELTAFRGLMPDVPFRDWIVCLQTAKVSVMTPERYLDAARLGIAEGLRSGITTYADTCDSGVALAAMCEMGVRGIMSQEVFAPSADDARVADAIAGLRRRLTELEPRQTPLVRLGISPHAPYTVSDPLFAFAARAGYPVAVHIAESEAETRFVRDGDGPFADGLRNRGIPVAPRARSPIALLDTLGVLDARPLLIHAVRIDEADIAAIARARATVAHCPVSNAKLGHG